MFEVALPSEISSLLNFLVLDVLLLPFIIYMSGKLAGYVNTHTLGKRGVIEMKEFDVPLIGGGMVMASGWRRTVFILLRFSVLVAVAVSNFGLEGRNSIGFVTRSGAVRVPGLLLDAENTITGVVLPQARCYKKIDEITTVYGSVIDGKCYKDIPDYTVVRYMTFHKTLNASARNCVPSYNCDNKPYPTTTYRCDSSDIVCHGVPKHAGCSNQNGMQKDAFRSLKCRSVSYGPQDDYAFFSLTTEQVAMPETSGPLKDCFAYDVKRANVERWNETFPSITTMVPKAIFASAYGASKEAQVTIPRDGLPRPVTGVRVRWVISTAWVLSVALVFSLWVLFHIYQGHEEILHDERSLVQEVRKRLSSIENLGMIDIKA